jgi:Sec-independent protein translocase protein TatA
MEILGIGPLELILIFIIALLVFGPNDMVKTGRTIGRFMRKIVMSDTWRAMSNLRYLPNVLMREAGLEETNKELKKDLDQLKDLGETLNSQIKQAGAGLSDWTTLPPTISPPPPAMPPPAQEMEKESIPPTISTVADAPADPNVSSDFQG